MHTPPSTSRARRFSELSLQRQMLVRLCQTTNFGSIRGLEIRAREPVFNSSAALVIDLKLDAGDPPRPETNLADFALSQELVRLIERLDELVAATIELLEIRAGIPRRVVFRARLPQGLFAPESASGSDLAGEASR